MYFENWRCVDCRMKRETSGKNEGKELWKAREDMKNIGLVLI